MYGGYVIHYEVSAILFALFLMIYHIVFLSRDDSEAGNKFRNLLLMIIVDGILDILSILTMGRAGLVYQVANYLVSSLFFSFAMFLGYSLTRYVDTYVLNRRYLQHVKKMMLLIAIIYSFLLIPNIFHGYFFSFDDSGNYIHGPLYVIAAFSPFIYIIYASALLFVGRKDLSRRQMINLWAFPVLVLLGNVIQVFVIPQYLLNTLCETLGVYILFFSLETPDYKRLIYTLNELEIARDAEKNANKSKSDFLARTSHEIRTPINAVIGMNEMIIRECDDKVIKEYASDSQNAAKTLLTIINDILDVSKIEAGKMEIVNSDYSLRTMLEDIKNMIKYRAKDKKLEFRLEIDPEIPDTLTGDEVRIKQIIINLITNAVKYTDKGFFLLRMTGENLGTTERLLVEVIDSGVGISPADIPKLTEAFERVNLERNKSIEGTGLGLNITAKLLGMMGTKLEVESDFGKGSRFFFTLDQVIVDDGKKVGVMTTETVKKEVIVGEASFVAPEAKILVVDDVPLNLKVIRGLIKRLKVKCETALSGMQCLEMVREEHYDMVLLDHMMPEMDGVETLKRIREEGLCKGVPIVALTANALVGAKEEYLGYGFDEYLSKPVMPEELESLLAKYLNKN